MGLGGPMNWWDPELCAALAQVGFYVVRYDNRDTGRSTVLRTPVLPVHAGPRVRRTRVRAPYGIGDLADDAFGLMDHLGFDSAHVVGVSMGGMIVQTMAIAHPDRLRSMTNIMSTTGKRTVGWQHPPCCRCCSPRTQAGRAAYIKTSSDFWGTSARRRTPAARNRWRRGPRRPDRGVSNAGVVRQMLAVLTQPNRRERLRGVQVPTLVIHGLADKMVHVSGGRATAAAVPGAELLLIRGMGHDLPPPSTRPWSRRSAGWPTGRGRAVTGPPPGLHVCAGPRAARRSRCRTRARWSGRW